MQRVLWAVVLTLVIGFGLPAPAMAEDHDRVDQKVDQDDDNVYDDLEDDMEGESGDSLVKIIAVFDEGRSAEQATESRAEIGDFSASYLYKTISAVAATLTVDQVRALSSDPDIVHIQADAPMSAHLDTARQAFGVDSGRVEFAVDGNNEASTDTTGSGALCSAPRVYCPSDSTVAVIDTGIHAAHADLDGGKVLGFANCLNTTSCTEQAPFDDNGHGTHVASTIVGDGDGSTTRSMNGVAPGAALVGVKVLAASGSGSTSGVDAGVEWVIANRDRFGIDILNMSLGSGGSSAGTDSTSRVVNRAAAAGITPFVSAGNSGPVKSTIGSPAAAKFAVTVGAMADPKDVDGTRVPGFSLASFSSRGPTADGRIKPDLVAAGVDITAAASGTTNGYSIKSGTSMSSPFAAGIGALVRDANPSLGSTGTSCPTTDSSSECSDGVVDASMRTTLKDALTSATTDGPDWGPPGPDNDYGHGRLDAYAAIEAASGSTGVGGPQLPTHTFVEGSLAGTGTAQSFPLEIASTDAPIALTLIMPSWTGTSSPDFDLYLLNPSGVQVAKATGTTRQETLAVTPTVTGTWTVRVSSYSGSGPFWFDASFPGAPPVPPPPPPVPETNASPVASDVAGATAEDTVGSVTLAAGDPDAQHCELAFSIVTQPLHGTLGSIGNVPCTAGAPNGDQATVTYTPATNYNGPDSFTYKVSDGQDDSEFATVAMTISSVNDLPVAAFTHSCSGRTCNFTDTSSDVDGTVTGWSWTFGSGSGASSVRNPSFTYASNGTYSVSLTVTDSGGATRSVTRSVTVTGADTTAPSAPTNLRGTPGSSRVTLTWSASTDTGGSGLAGYYVYRSSSQGGAYSRVRTTTSTSWTNGDLSRNRTYWYYVIAFDRAGNRSGASNTVSVRTT